MKQSFSGQGRDVPEWQQVYYTIYSYGVASLSASVSTRLKKYRQSSEEVTNIELLSN